MNLEPREGPNIKSITGKENQSDFDALAKRKYDESER
jgi:hypothetical protein